MTTKLKLFQDTLNRKFRRTAIIGNRNFKCTLNGVDSGVRSIIMNKGILWQCADTGHDRVTHVPNSSTGKSQAHTHTWCIWFIHSLSRTHTQLKAISVNSDLYRPNKIYLTTGKKWWMYFSSLFLCSSLLPLFLSFSQSLWMCQQGTKSEKERKWNETACVYTQLRNPLLSYYNYCRQILMTSVENINLKFTPAVLHMCMAERNDTWQSASKL